MIQARDLVQAHPELRDRDDDQGVVLYHHLLQRSLISWIQQHYPTTWEVDTFPLDFGDAHGYMFASKNVPSQVFSGSELSQRLAGNKFASLNGPFGPNLGLALPLRTTLEIIPPRQDSQVGHMGRIVLKNWYCTIAIETRRASGMRGIGSYATLIGLTEQQDNAIWTNQYIVIADVAFAKFLAGHPDMPRYRKWASDIISGLVEDFDESVAWPRARDAFILKQHQHP